MVIQNSHIRRGSKGDSTLFFFSLICIEQTPNTIDALYPPILVKKKYYYKLSSPPASHEAHLNFSSNYRVKKLHKFQLVEGLRGASKAPFKSLQQRFNQYFRTNKRDTPKCRKNQQQICMPITSIVRVSLLYSLPTTVQHASPQIFLGCIIIAYIRTAD